jgi:hypothetical protein
MGGSHSGDSGFAPGQTSIGHIAFVVQRGICFAPTTSPIEQSFSVVAERLGTKRLAAQPIQ